MTMLQVAARDGMAGYRGLYKVGQTPRIVEVPVVMALMIDGAGKPEDSPAFQEAVQAPYSLTYTTKFALKADARAAGYKVMSLEGLRWVRENNLRPRGAHHEIYLGDPRRADPSRLKTILRQPVAS